MMTWDRLAQPPKLTSSKILDLALRSRRRLGEWGVRAGSPNRLDGAIELLRTCQQRAVDLHTADAVTLDRVADATRLAIEMHVATHGIAEATEETVRKTTIALGGHAVAEAEQNHLARNTQHELYVHGLLNAGGGRAWFQEPPDIRFDYDGEQIGAAAKRIWSPDQLRRRLGEGAGQIEAAGIRGIIALNVETYLAGLQPTANDDLLAKGSRFEEAIERLRGHGPYLAGKKHILGVLALGTAVGWAVGKHVEVAASVYTWLWLIGDTDEDSRLAQAWFANWRGRLDAWMSENY